MVLYISLACAQCASDVLLMLILSFFSMTLSDSRSNLCGVGMRNVWNLKRSRGIKKISLLVYFCKTSYRWFENPSLVFTMILNILRSWVFPSSPISVDCCVCSKHLFQLNPCLWILHQFTVRSTLMTRERKKDEYSCFVFSNNPRLIFGFLWSFSTEEFSN